MRRVLLTVHKFFPEHKAGTEVLVLKVAQELQKRHYDVLVVTAAPPDTDARHPEGNISHDYVFQGVKVHVIGEALRLQNYQFSYEYYHPLIKNHVAELIQKFQPHLVHIFHAQNLSASIIDAALESKVPVVLSTTDFWFVCPIVQLKKPDGAVCRGPSVAATNCLTCYGPHLIPPKDQLVESLEARLPKISEKLAKLTLVKQSFYDALIPLYVVKKLPEAVSAIISRPYRLKDLANKAKAIMVPTQLMRDIFVENGINSELIFHVPFGIDTSTLESFQEKTISKTLRIGFIGTLFEHKGPDLLIEAFQKLPSEADAELRIYGDINQFPEYGEMLKKLVASKPSHSLKIQFYPTFPNKELGKVLQSLDVLVVPSRWYENTPLVIQSSLATKTPLIVTNLGGMSELVKHEFNGLLFELNDVNSLCQQLTRLLNDREFLETLRQNITTQRTMANMVDDIESVYTQVRIPFGNQQQTVKVT